jgi:hypothetical protein
MMVNTPISVSRSANPCPAIPAQRAQAGQIQVDATAASSTIAITLSAMRAFVLVTGDQHTGMYQGSDDKRRGLEEHEHSKRLKALGRLNHLSHGTAHLSFGCETSRSIKPIERQQGAEERDYV